MTLSRLRLPAITFFVVLSSLAAVSADSSAAPEPTLESPPVISGTPIITGLQNQNELHILQGAAATAALAFLAEAAWLLGLCLIERQPVEA